MTSKEKDRFRDIQSAYSYFGDVPLWKALALADMAVRDVVPDGTFGDDDCIIWGKFRRIYELRDRENPII